MKIITFTKNNQFQALLQFSDPVNAQQAKLVSKLQGNDSRSCEISVHFSPFIVYEEKIEALK